MFLEAGIPSPLSVCCTGHANQPDLTIEMDAQAEAGGRRYRIDALIDIVQVGEHLTTRLERDGAAVYYSDGMLYLGDGTSVRVDMGFPDYAALLDTVAGLYRDGDISAFSNSGENIYSVTVSGERVSSILKALFPDSASYLASLESLNLDLVAKGNELSAPPTLDEGNSRYDGSRLYIPGR